MAMTYDEAVATVTAEGGRFEMATAVIDGQELPVYKHAPPSLRTVFDLVRANEGTFLVYEDERLSFGEVMAKVDALAATLVDTYGITKGDRVAISMRNYPEWVMTYAASLSIGAVAVCLNAWWTTDEMLYGLEDSGAEVLLADQERVERVAPLLADGRTDVKVIAVRTPDPLPAGVEHLDDVLLVGAPMPQVDIDVDDDATILYTSGTTGEPKGALSTHRAIISALMAFGCRAAVNNVLAASANEGKEPPTPHPYPTCFILIVPLFHVTGCIPVMLSCFVTGCKLVMMRKWEPERALELIERERVTMFVGVPTMSWDLLESPDFSKRDTSSLVSVGGGGAPAPPELVRRVDKSFSSARPGIGYGMTETNAYGPQNAGDDYVRKATSAGRTVPLMQVRVVGDDGTALGTDEVGEIEFRGANLIKGYWNKPEATAEAFHDGWLRTGDLGRIDDEGFVYVEDRAKDMVLRGGENVYCAEIEAVLYEHGDVYEVAVFGVPHERLGEEVAAAVVLRDDATTSADELQAHVAAKLAPFKVPSRIVFYDEQLPRGATGKILKRDIRDEVVAAEGSGSAN
jgi:long-chain acyl-CoA synthetase